MISCDLLALRLTEKFGLPVEAVGKSVSEGYKITIFPLDVDRRIGFTIEIVVGWRNITAKFLPANFAASLVMAMQSATEDKRSNFLSFANSIIEKGGNVNVNISGSPVKSLEIITWPKIWESIEIFLRKNDVVIEAGNEVAATQVIYPWINRFFGMIISLLPLEEAISSVHSGYEEGAEYDVISKRYERSKINRAACIEINGVFCHVCGMNFKKLYGDLGEGFIHVHHIVPVSTMNRSYVIDPSKDLVPVCPNCHSMLHRKTPPISISNLKQIIKLAT